MRINHVKKARKAQGKCSRCGTELGKGSAYIWIKPRYGGKRIRCTDPKCRFRPSEMTSSDKLSRLYGAQEGLEDFVYEWDGDEGDVSALKEALETACEEIREVGEEYRESAENIREHFSESSTADECEERADEVEGWADSIESANDELVDFEKDDEMTAEEGSEDDPRDADGRDFETWRSEMTSVAENALSDCPV